MIQVLLVIHLLVTVVMIGLILLQRSEGGGLGIGGGNGGMGAFAGPRAAANILTKATMTCFALFVGLSLLLAILSNHHAGKASVLDQLDQTPAAATSPADAAAPAKPAAEPNKTNTSSQVPIPE